MTACFRLVLSRHSQQQFLSTLMVCCDGKVFTSIYVDNMKKLSLLTLYLLVQADGGLQSDCGQTITSGNFGDEGDAKQRTSPWMVAIG